MTTYASPRITKRVLQLSISILFLSGCFILLASIIEIINYISNLNRDDDDDDHQNLTNDHRFPSITSPSVQLLLGILTTGHGVFGIIAIHIERTVMVQTYGHVLTISCFTKFLFIIATLLMYATIKSETVLSSIPGLIIGTGIIELILIMCVCQFAKLVKRGDAARQEVQSIHSFRLERQRSRSQSRLRSVWNLAPAPGYIVSGSERPLDSVSITRSIEPSPSKFQSPTINDDSSNSYFAIPPPIYLKLDR